MMNEQVLFDQWTVPASPALFDGPEGHCRTPGLFKAADGTLSTFWASKDSDYDGIVVGGGSDLSYASQLDDIENELDCYNPKTPALSQHVRGELDLVKNQIISEISEDNDALLQLETLMGEGKDLVPSLMSLWGNMQKQGQKMMAQVEEHAKKLEHQERVNANQEKINGATHERLTNMELMLRQIISGELPIAGQPALPAPPALLALPAPPSPPSSDESSSTRSAGKRPGPGRPRSGLRKAPAASAQGVETCAWYPITTSTGKQARLICDPALVQTCHFMLSMWMTGALPVIMMPQTVKVHRDGSKTTDISWRTCTYCVRGGIDMSRDDFDDVSGVFLGHDMHMKQAILEHSNTAYLPYYISDRAAEPIAKRTRRKKTSDEAAQQVSPLFCSYSTPPTERADMTSQGVEADFALPSDEVITNYKLLVRRLADENGGDFPDLSSPSPSYSAVVRKANDTLVPYVILSERSIEIWRRMVNTQHGTTISFNDMIATLIRMGIMSELDARKNVHQLSKINATPRLVLYPDQQRETMSTAVEAGHLYWVDLRNFLPVVMAACYWTGSSSDPIIPATAGMHPVIFADNFFAPDPHNKPLPFHALMDHIMGEDQQNVENIGAYVRTMTGQDHFITALSNNGLLPESRLHQLGVRLLDDINDGDMGSEFSMDYDEPAAKRHCPRGSGGGQ